jgi:hypothetical protein
MKIFGMKETNIFHGFMYLWKNYCDISHALQYVSLAHLQLCFHKLLVEHT